MKTNAIVRIILWSLLAVILSGILIAGLVVGPLIEIGSQIEWDKIGVNFDDSGYSVGETDIDEDISSVEIHWVAGSVKVEPFDGDKIEIRESGYAKESDKLRYRVTDGRLVIRFSKSNVFFIFGVRPPKDLVLRLPRSIAADLKALEIESVSAGVFAGDLNAGELNVKSVSGSIELDGITAGKADLESVSGSINASHLKTETLDTNNVSGGTEIYGDIQRVDAEAVSGKITVSSETAMQSAEINTVSGAITLYLPDGSGFTAKHETVSGRINSDFAFTTAGKKYTCGDGKCEIDAETVSGDLNIRKIQ